MIAVIEKMVDWSVVLSRIQHIKKLSGYSLYALSAMDNIAGIAQLVEHDLAKVGVASSSLVSRSRLYNTRESINFW